MKSKLVQLYKKFILIQVLDATLLNWIYMIQEAFLR